MSKTSLIPHRGKTPVVDPRAYLSAGVWLIGDVVVGARCNIWYGAVLRGDTGSIVLGEGCSIQDNCVLHTSQGPEGGILLGRNVIVTHSAVLHACTIGDDCFIGMGSLILDGAVVEEGCFIEPGTLLAPGTRTRKGELWGPAEGRGGRKLRDMTAADRQKIRDLQDLYTALLKDNT